MFPVLGNGHAASVFPHRDWLTDHVAVSIRETVPEPSFASPSLSSTNRAAPRAGKAELRMVP